ncbi:hypothetical protein ACOJBO_28665 [Rhizobium beringeri]|jgi:hypothetical protein
MSPNLLSSWATSIGRDGSGFRLERFSFSWKRRTVLTFYFHAIPGKIASRFAWEIRFALFPELL